MTNLLCFRWIDKFSAALRVSGHGSVDKRLSRHELRRPTAVSRAIDRVDCQDLSVCSDNRRVIKDLFTNLR